ncbi:MAG: transcriptional regulator [Raineya sp.]|jgi:plasmid maintenance system antidote protein VapI|nr:transcriptional regulator [Raineya sp.]
MEKTANQRFMEVKQMLNINNSNLAKELQVSHTAIKNIVDGNTGVSVNIAKRLKEAFNISSDWLLDGIGEMYLQQPIKSMEETVNERIKRLMDYKKMNKSSFAKEIKISPQTLQNIVEGRQNNPSFEVISKIVNRFDDINPKWLILGKGEKFINKETLKEKEEGLTYRDIIIELRGYLKGVLSNDVWAKVEPNFPKFKVYSSISGVSS